MSEAGLKTVSHAADADRADAVARLREAELMLDLTRRIAMTDSLEEVLRLLVQATTAEVGAERGSIFLNDPSTGELYTRFAEGGINREIRILNNTGIAGHVFSTGRSETVRDAYGDDRFNRSVDARTGFTTRSILCVPVRTAKGEIIGAAEVLNKSDGAFTEADRRFLESATQHAAIAIEAKMFVEKTEQTRAQEREFLDIVAEITSEIDLKVILWRVMSEATRMLRADRSTLFLNDEKTGELFAKVGEGLDTEIRLPNTAGIAGAVFTSGETVNIPHAYADLRFNPALDRQTGYFTRNILCVPVVSKNGKVIGVTQCLNKRGGTFTDEDEQRLRAFTGQVAIALEHAKLFDDIQNIKNYNEAMLESMSNGVITIDEEGTVVTCNHAGQSILAVEPADILKKPRTDLFKDRNAWVLERIDRVEERGTQDSLMDVELCVGDDTISVNMTILPLRNPEHARLGVMVMLEDISSEKRMKSTMSRYMDPGIADQLLQGGEEILGGKSTEATVLFSDIRGFTPLTENLGAQGTVSLLNEYFTIMVECIADEGGMLDKFIGDAIMAGFGVPFPHDDDEDRAVRAAIAMISKLEAWNRERGRLDLMPVRMGIGLNTDTVVAGNIGSPKRMDFTMIGDGVNLAARLESACKQYGARILLSELTRNGLKGTYRMRDIDLVVVKGKSHPVRVFELLDYHDEESFPNLAEALQTFREALAAFRGRQWEVARQGFEACLALNPADGVASLYVDRCGYMALNPPADDWDGRWVLDAK